MHRKNKNIETVIRRYILSNIDMSKLKMSNNNNNNNKNNNNNNNTYKSTLTTLNNALSARYPECA